MNVLYILGTLIALFLYSQAAKSKRKRLKLQEENNRRLRNEFSTIIPEIIAANHAFSTMTGQGATYFSNCNLQLWHQKYTPLYNLVLAKSAVGIGLKATDVDAISNFTDIYSNAENHRKIYNTTFIAKELTRYQHFFSNVEGRSLDLQQRTAVITDEDNNIVIAGAGSGKTTTIVGKVNYIMDRYKVKPEEILLISFTKKSAETLAERINIEGVEAKTFHKFGKDVISAAERQQPSIFSEAQFRPLLQRFFTEELQKPAYLDKVTKYFTDLLKPYKSQFEFEDQGSYIQYLKDHNVRPYREVPNIFKGTKTTRLEIVKSMEECRIANFLYFNGVTYDYEYPYEHQTATELYRQYKPDFRITHNGKVIYLEHYALSKNGDVPSWFTSKPGQSAREIYHEGIRWKRELHAEHNTTVLETFSYQMQDGTLFDSLYTQLTAQGVPFKPRSASEIWKIINASAQEEIKSLIDLFSTFITLLKSNNYSFDFLGTKNATISGPEKIRNKALIEIIAPLYAKYQNYLAERQEIDFSDMINIASGYIRDGKFIKPYRYIIIDEFQDISIGRYGLIKAIIGQNPTCRLFCVGDDWQSIYRFTGSDLTLFKDFSKHFGVSASSKIETTYRFNSPLIETSGAFIEKNPNQARKKLTGFGSNPTTYSIEYSTGDETDDSGALQKIFYELSMVEGIKEKSIMILGRYRFDFDRIKNSDSTFIIGKENQEVLYANYTGPVPVILKAEFMTVHKAKGLEADIIIVLNCNSGKHGFPSQLSDDPVLNLLLSNADQFENGEERRLFYVAMTRAKEQLFLIAGANTKSKFIMELETGASTTSMNKCPECKTTDLVQRKQGVAKNGNTYRFYGCANYAYGCDHTEMKWENRPKVYLN
jgi:DNA helicase-4